MHQTVTKNIVFTAIISSLLLLTACENNDSTATASSSSSSSSSSYGGYIPQLNLDNVQVHFPPPVVSTQDERIIVRGEVADTSDVTQVFVNGTSISSSDSLATWQAEIALDLGLNTLVVTQEDSNGLVTEVSTLKVLRETALITPKSMVVDRANNRFLVWDKSLKALLAIDLTSGIKTRISPPTIQGVNLIDDPKDMVLDPVRNRVILYTTVLYPTEETKAKSIAAIDLTSGEQTWVVVEGNSNLEILASNIDILTQDSTAYIAGIENVYLDKDKNRVAIKTVNSTAINLGIIDKVDLATGTKTTLSSYGIPDTSFTLDRVVDMATAPNSELLYGIDYVKNFDIYRLYTINKVTGKGGILIFTDAEDKLLILSAPKAIEFDFDNQRLYILNNNRVLSLNLETGKYSILADSITPEGSNYLLRKIEAMTYSDGQLFVLDDSLDYILSIDTETGLRTQVAGAGIDNPDGVAAYVSAMDVTLDAEHNRVFATDRLVGSLTSVNLETGEKTLLAKRPVSVPANDEAYLNSPRVSTLNYTKGELMILDNANQLSGSTRSSSAPKLFTVDPETAEITQTLAFGSPYIDFYDMVFHEGSQTSYSIEEIDQRKFAAVPTGYIPSSYIRKIDLSGDKPIPSIISGAGLPNNDYPFIGIRSLAIDYMHNRLLVADITQKAIISVDLANGVRSQFSNFGYPINAGPELAQPKAIVVDEKHNRALVLDSAKKVIIAIDLETGLREVIVENVAYSYNKLYNPQDMDLHPVFDYVVLVDDTSDSLMAVDLLTNQKVMLSR